MTDRISIAAQISAIGRATGRLNGSCPQATRSEVAEEIRLLDAVSDTLRWLADNREWIAPEYNRREQEGTK